MESPGFIGLGVMGEPMCRNLARKSGRPLVAYDVRAAGSAVEVMDHASVVFLSLPSGVEVKTVCEGADGLVAHARAGQCVVDLGTSPVTLARSLSAQLAERGAFFADAPVARTREAAIAGTLSIMVGADDPTYARIAPFLATMGSEITHCGGVGSGQLVKIMNNMVLAQTVVALSEALAAARRNGVDGSVLFEALAKGSADSFALRNHGMKAMLPGAFPERAFSTEYMLKDLQYALDLAREVGFEMRGASNVHALLLEALAAGHGKAYWPVVCRAIDSA
jgi:3-hydroxyisobutyrate dehydrogenase-like beta-hydroxyacid dehydrogenase